MPEYNNNHSNHEMTYRQQILQLLESGPHSCRELSQSVHQSEKEILSHLEHLRSSLRSKNLILQIDPAICRHCGFVFELRTRLAKPGKCPECRNSSIEPPLYSIAAKK